MDVPLLLGVKHLVAVSADVLPHIIVDIPNVFLVVVPRVVDDITLDTLGGVERSPHLPVLRLGLVGILLHSAMDTQELA